MFLDKVVSFSTARQALYHYIKKNRVKKTLLPVYLPEGVLDPFKQLNIELDFYDNNSSLLLDDALEKKILDFKPEFVLYIHLGGLYIAENVHFLERLKLKYGFEVIYDYAHSLPRKVDLHESNETRIYSPYKILPIPDLGFISCKSEFENNKTWRGFLLKIRLTANLIAKKLARSSSTNVILLKIFSYIGRYYPYLMKNYTQIYDSASLYSRAFFLKVVRKESVYKNRIQNAQLYCDLINEKFLVPNIAMESYLAQPLFGFPIFIKERNKFCTYLKANSVNYIILEDRWDLALPKKSDGFVKRHLYLPISNSYNIDETRRICAIVNEYRE